MNSEQDATCADLDERVEQAIKYAHDVGFDESYEVGWQEGYDEGLEVGHETAQGA